MKKYFNSLFLLLFFGLLIRLLFIPHPGFEADIAYWKWWGEAASLGPANALNTTSINYPPFFIYVLGAIWKIYAFFSPHLSIEQLYQNNNFIFLLIVKLPAIISDIVIGYYLYWLVREVTPHKAFFAPEASSLALAKGAYAGQASNFKRNKNFSLLTINYSLPLLAAGLYLFNPVTIYDSAVWGQTDSIAAALSLISLITLLKQKVWLTFIIALIALETKVQTVIFLPFLFLLTLRWFGIKKCLEALSVSAGTFLIINLPYIINGLMVRAMGLIFESASYFPLASLNAYNFWWLLSNGNGFYVSDSTLFGQAVTYKFLGMFAFVVVYSLLAVSLWQKSKIKLQDVKETRGQSYTLTSFDKAQDKSLSAGKETINLANHLVIRPFSHLYSISLIFSASAFAFFMLPTQIHERYIFPIFVFLPIFLCLNILKLLSTQKNYSPACAGRLFIINYSLIFFLLLSISIFLNLHLVLVMNYSNNGFPLLSLLNKPGIYLPTTLFLSTLNIFLFIFLLVMVFRKMSPKILLGAFGFFICFIFLQLAVSFLNRQQIIISLTRLKPILAKQDWGSLQINKTVDKRLLSGSYVWYKEGLGTHANSQIDFNLNKDFSKFTVDAGIDTEAGDNASVEFIISGDGKELFKSQVVKKWNWPLHIEVPLLNVDKLTLIVTDGGDGKNGDHADWLNPKLYK